MTDSPTYQHCQSATINTTNIGNVMLKKEFLGKGIHFPYFISNNHKFSIKSVPNFNQTQFRMLMAIFQTMMAVFSKWCNQTPPLSIQSIKISILVAIFQLILIFFFLTWWISTLFCFLSVIFHLFRECRFLNKAKVIWNDQNYVWIDWNLTNYVSSNSDDLNR